MSGIATNLARGACSAQCLRSVIGAEGGSSPLGQPGSYLAPPRNPRAVLDRVVAEQCRGLGPHQLADPGEPQPDLLLGARNGPRPDDVPQSPDIRSPTQA